MRRWAVTFGLSTVALGLGVVSSPMVAQEVDPPPTVEPLGSHLPPAPDRSPGSVYDSIVKDEKWLLALGKALFWDSSVGGDGNACASCHFNAGADPRVANQLSPGILRLPLGDGTFGGIAPTPTALRGKTRSGQPAGANIRLTPSDFPFHVLQNPLNRNSPVLYDTNDVVSSQGVFSGTFIGVDSRVRFQSGVVDFCAPGVDPFFRTVIGGQPRQVRRVEPRNTPTTINAAFNFRNFWDGRANNRFNGSSPHGRRDPDAGIHRLVAGNVELQRLDLENSSLASQAVGPPNSDFEMACGGRSFAFIGRKMLPRLALAGQKIAPTDSVFGANGVFPASLILTPGNRGLRHTYLDLVQRAFENDLWSATVQIDGFTQAEQNFDLFFGLAIDAYERTLISGNTPFDRDPDLGGPSTPEGRGKQVFLNEGKCVNCHTGPLFSSAAVPPRQPNQLVEHMLMGDNGVAFYDGGFYNIGVRPTHEDLGVGGETLGKPLAFSRQHVNNDRVDPFNVDETTFEEPCATSPCETDRVAVDGAFKTPTLRNVALTAPYFHNGGQATLEQVVAFYNRGGDRRGPNGNDTTGTGPKGQTRPVTRSMGGSNLDADIRPLNLTPQQQADLVAFMKALTDERVQCHRGPFDHPELIVPNGHKLTAAGNRAADAKLRLREVGRAGYSASACAPNTGNLFTYNLIGPGKMLEPLP